VGEKGVGAAIEFFALALELGEVGVQKPFPLAFGVGDGLSDAL
jgi:hypothetical protein